MTATRRSENLPDTSWPLSDEVVPVDQSGRHPVPGHPGYSEKYFTNKCRFHSYDRRNDRYKKIC